MKRKMRNARAVSNIMFISFWGVQSFNFQQCCTRLHANGKCGHILPPSTPAAAAKTNTKTDD